MKKIKSYRDCVFGADVIREALQVFIRQLPEDNRAVTAIRTVETGYETWRYDTDEEFFAAYRRPCIGAHLYKDFRGGKPAASLGNFEFSLSYNNSSVEITRPLASQIEEVFNVFEKNLEESKIPPPPPPAPTVAGPKIFIGHGRSPLWRDLKDHLTDKQGYSVTAYEVGARAGHTIRDILDEMLTAGSFALLVMTGEDETISGDLRPRQNVVHELGLFQGKLGFSRAIAVVENGVELFSNIDGVQQLRFSPGNIAEVYGDVLATLRREFGESR